MSSLYLTIVSAQEEIFSGSAQCVFAAGSEGELEILPQHAPLLTQLLPGPLRLQTLSGTQEVIYVSGGILEVQPKVVTILADVVVRAADFDEAKATEVKQQAEKALSQQALDYAHVRAELARAAGMLRAIREAKRNLKR